MQTSGDRVVPPKSRAAFFTESDDRSINSLEDEAAFVFVTTNMPGHGVHVPVASAHDVERRNRLNARMNANRN